MGIGGRLRDKLKVVSESPSYISKVRRDLEKEGVWIPEFREEARCTVKLEGKNLFHYLKALNINYLDIEIAIDFQMKGEKPDSVIACSISEDINSGMWFDYPKDKRILEQLKKLLCSDSKKITNNIRHKKIYSKVCFDTTIRNFIFDVSEDAVEVGIEGCHISVKALREYRVYYLQREVARLCELNSQGK